MSDICVNGHKILQVLPTILFHLELKYTIL